MQMNIPYDILKEISLKKQKIYTEKSILKYAVFDLFYPMGWGKISHALKL
jgi:hypothetical protein